MKRRGTILVAVLVVTLMASMVVASLMFRVQAELSASNAGRLGQQAYCTAQSGLERAMQVLKSSSSDMTVWYDNPDLFQDQLVFQDPMNSWYFSIYAGNSSDPTTVRFGLTDEAAKINLNTASPDVLGKLPNMTSDMVDCLIDWRDPDSDVRPQGAEADYYSRLAIPYAIKNGPLTTLEELLLVKGFNGSVVYGQDYNMNGVLDAGEQQSANPFSTTVVADPAAANSGGSGEPPVASELPDSTMTASDSGPTTGLVGIATVNSYEFDVSNSGSARINLNTSDPNAASGLQAAGLSAKTVDFIRVYRSEGNTFKSPADLLGMTYQPKTSSPASKSRAAASPAADASVEDERRASAPDEAGGAAAGQSIESGVDGSNLAVVMDKFTVHAGGAKTPVVGLVNVNTAPLAVLSVLPGMDAALAQQIIDARATVDPQKKTTIAWLYTENIVPADKFKVMASQLTARSYQYRVRCVGYGIPVGRYFVIEAVIDLAQKPPRIVYWRDLTRLGVPVPFTAQQRNL